MNTAPWRLGLLAVAAIGLGGCRGPVQTGVDVLVESGFALLRGRRVAVLTNRTGRSSEGVRTIDLLDRSPEVELVRLLSPEHGLSTDREGKIGDATDSATGLPVFSLYGETRRPTRSMLSEIDTVVFDVQDIGARFYTYITTLGYLMEECGRLGVRVVVLDRPNPIAPLGVDGPDADADLLDFIAYQSMPVTHGLTVGELALWFNAEFGLGCEVEVVPMRGWSHDRWWDECGLPWIDPSPNIRNATQALLYPGLGLLEATNLSVGRGTDHPFECIGAPWIEGERLADELNALELIGARFEPIDFTPAASVFAGEACGGVAITVVDRDRVRPVILGLTIGWVLERLHGERFDDERILRLMKNRIVLDGWRRTPDPRELGRLWSGSVAEFESRTAPYRLYP